MSCMTSLRQGGDNMLLTAMLLARNITPSDDGLGGVDMARLPFLRVDDVARIWGEERAKKTGSEDRPLARRTVYWILREAKVGMYADNPPPMPIYPDDENQHGKVPVWVPDGRETLTGLERRLRAWYQSRPGQGAGGGRRAATDDHLGGPGEKSTSPGGKHGKAAD